jgi:hypothetical protein
VSQPIDLPALRAALTTLTAHRTLIVAAGEDTNTPAPLSALLTVQEALAHILDDEFRGPKDRGGS